MTSRINGETIAQKHSGWIYWKIEDMIAHASSEERLVVGVVFGTGMNGNGSGGEHDRLRNRVV